MIKVIETRVGRMMYLEKDNIMGKSLSHYGETHFHEAELLLKVLEPGDVVIDAGANIGALTIPFAQKVGKDGYVVAIEAQPFIFNMLCGNLALNGLQHVQPLNRAVAHRSNIMAYMPELNYAEDDNYGGIPLASDFNSKDSKGRPMVKPVPTITIDDLNLAKPKLIKIDVEGMEVVTLEGAVKTIRRAKPILHVEFIQDREEILKFLKSEKYEWKLHEPTLFNENNFRGISEDVLLTDQGLHMVSGDLFCWHKDTPVKVESSYFVDLDASENPRHKLIKSIRDKVYGV